MSDRIGCSIYFAGGDSIRVTDSQEFVLRAMRVKEVFTVQVVENYGNYRAGSIVGKHVVAVVNN